MKLFAEAARNGHMQAEYQRALLYLHGVKGHVSQESGPAGHARKEVPWIVKPDAHRGVKYLARAAGGGVVSAQREVARCCLAGIGMEANVEAARSWLTKAAESEDAGAMVQLAHLLLHQVKTNPKTKMSTKTLVGAWGVYTLLSGPTMLAQVQRPLLKTNWETNVCARVCARVCVCVSGFRCV